MSLFHSFLSTPLHEFICLICGHPNESFYHKSQSGEMAYTEDLKSSDENHAGSSPASGTTSLQSPDHYKSDIAERIDLLGQQRAVMIDYLQMKVDEKDWHGVQDAGSDLRDIESEIKGLNFAK